MWLATTHGWFSIVKKPEGFHIRARVEADLRALRKAAELKARIQRWPAADYRFRMIVDAVELGQVMQALMDGLTYPNFKSEIARRPAQKPKLHAYHEIWAIMAGLQR